MGYREASLTDVTLTAQEECVLTAATQKAVNAMYGDEPTQPTTDQDTVLKNLPGAETRKMRAALLAGGVENLGTYVGHSVVEACHAAPHPAPATPAVSSPIKPSR